MKTAIGIRGTQVLALSIASALAGCGGGGGNGGGDDTSYSSSGAVTAPNGTLASREPAWSERLAALLLSPARAAVSGLSPIASAEVKLVALDDSGTAGDPIAVTTADGQGRFTIETSAAPAGNLVLMVSNGSLEMRAPFTGEDMDISPVTEAVVRAVVSQVGSGSSYDEFAAKELSTLVKLAESKDVDLSGAAGIDDAVTDVANNNPELADVVEGMTGTATGLEGDYHLISAWAEFGIDVPGDPSTTPTPVGMYLINERPKINFDGDGGGTASWLSVDEFGMSADIDATGATSIAKSTDASNDDESESFDYLVTSNGRVLLDTDDGDFEALQAVASADGLHFAGFFADHGDELDGGVTEVFGEALLYVGTQASQSAPALSGSYTMRGLEPQYFGIDNTPDPDYLAVSLSSAAITFDFNAGTLAFDSPAKTDIELGTGDGTIRDVAVGIQTGSLPYSVSDSGIISLDFGGGPQPVGVAATDGSLVALFTSPDSNDTVADGGVRDIVVGVPTGSGCSKANFAESYNTVGLGAQLEPGTAGTAPDERFSLIGSGFRLDIDNGGSFANNEAGLTWTDATEFDSVLDLNDGQPTLTSAISGDGTASTTTLTVNTDCTFSGTFGAGEAVDGAVSQDGSVLIFNYSEAGAREFYIGFARP